MRPPIGNVWQNNLYCFIIMSPKDPEAPLRPPVVFFGKTICIGA